MNDDDDLDAMFAAQLAAGRAAADDTPPHPAEGNGDSGPQPIATLRLTRLSTVRPEPVEWAWPDRIPLGKVTMLDGLPDMGKSTIAIDIAARVTTGDEMPDRSRGALYGRSSPVIMLTAEDGLADTVRPRFDAAGGDTDLVHVVTSTVVRAGTRTDERWPDLDRDLDALERAIRSTGARLVVVDVLMAYLASDVNTYKDQDVRRVLSPLAAMAERTGCAIVCLRHPTKSGSSVAVLSGGGSIGIIGAARVGLLAGYDPDDTTEDLNARRRLLAVAKCNIAAKAATMAYRLHRHPGDLMAHIVWEGETAHRAEDLSTPPERRGDDTEHGNVDLAAKALIADLLEAGPMLSAEVAEYMRENGIDARTGRRHLHRLGGEARKLTGEVGSTARGWAWTLTPPLTDGEVAALAERYDRLYAKPKRKTKAPKGTINAEGVLSTDETPSGESVPFDAPDFLPAALREMVAPDDQPRDQ